MAKGKFVSYLRVSTDKQGRSGLGVEAQREAVARAIPMAVAGSWSQNTLRQRAGSGVTVALRGKQAGNKEAVSAIRL